MWAGPPFGQSSLCVLRSILSLSPCSWINSIHHSSPNLWCLQESGQATRYFLGIKDRPLNSEQWSSYALKSQVLHIHDSDTTGRQRSTIPYNTEPPWIHSSKLRNYCGLNPRPISGPIWEAKMLRNPPGPDPKEEITGKYGRNLSPHVVICKELLVTVWDSYPFTVQTLRCIPLVVPK